MISYAQNFEDILLARAFCDVAQGCYVDVGAWDPEIDSVTRHFYDLGWRGVNIEPHPYYFRALCTQREHDLNFDSVISSSQTERPFYEAGYSGVSSLHKELCDGFAHLFPYTERLVATRTLTSVLEEAGTQEIQFLKVDVEGHEAEVLESLDWSRWRPQIVVVESVHPVTHESAHGSWEPRLLSEGYLFTYFDGLNRFYVASEHSELQLAFSTPPNVFDNFVLAQVQRLTNELQASRLREAESAQAYSALTTQLAELAGAPAADGGTAADLVARIDTMVRELRSAVERLREQLQATDCKCLPTRAPRRND